MAAAPLWTVLLNEVSLTTPQELGGPVATVPKSEKMFAAGYAVCFLGAIQQKELASDGFRFLLGIFGDLDRA